MGDNTYINYKCKLENKYLSDFEKIELYINGSVKLDNKEKNNCLQQILDSFLSGQSEGKAIEVITGKSLKNYCDSMIYGESMYIHKASRISLTVFGTFLYILFIEFFTRFLEVVIKKNWSLIIKPVHFNIGDIILIVGYMYIPKLISIITRNYFENPVRCRKIKKYTYNVVWIITIIIYTFLKDMFREYSMVISLKNVLFICIYSFVTIIIAEVIQNNIGNRKRNANKEYIYNQYLKSRYEKYKLKCEKLDRKAVDWNKFLKKRSKENSIYATLFFIYVLIFSAFIVLTLKYIIFHNADISSSLILVICCIFDMILVAVVLEGIRRNTQLTKKINKSDNEKTDC